LLLWWYKRVRDGRRGAESCETGEASRFLDGAGTSPLEVNNFERCEIVEFFRVGGDVGAWGGGELR
jgi:hypothetical protein